MRRKIRSWLFFRLLFQPGAVFEELSETRPSPYVVFFRYLIWLAALPPLFLYIGASRGGWHLGAAEPLFLEPKARLAFSIAYFLALVLGVVLTGLISHWMADNYGAPRSLGIHLAMVVIVGAPIGVCSAIHLYPHIFVNVLVLIPALMWSMYLLYRGLPVVLRIGPERGMLMASSLIGWLLVAAVSLLGLTVALWSNGVGPSMRV